MNFMGCVGIQTSVALLITLISQQRISFLSSRSNYLVDPENHESFLFLVRQKLGVSGRERGIDGNEDVVDR